MKLSSRYRVATPLVCRLLQLLSPRGQFIQTGLTDKPLTRSAKPRSDEALKSREIERKGEDREGEKMTAMIHCCR